MLAIAGAGGETIGFGLITITHIVMIELVLSVVRAEATDDIEINAV